MVRTYHAQGRRPTFAKLQRQPRQCQLSQCDANVETNAAQSLRESEGYASWQRQVYLWHLIMSVERKTSQQTGQRSPSRSLLGLFAFSSASRPAVGMPKPTC